ncbi:immunity 63 family protein [Turneriella parva]|uniref:Immunity protein 63 domain-containing protein n=1 Tax=Turneriella parva (strain ATCC BAA-1111 / DSM 21527 / NCTC 11395 / H) TaxID=869212 RepID=I4B5W3_TURPD|nr:immunity 63 family protein [Turneriella parva]AFM12670.1 hypothetical protein Turpa_2024 [Turneriella parva DSM 21527]
MAQIGFTAQNYAIRVTERQGDLALYAIFRKNLLMNHLSLLQIKNLVRKKAMLISAPNNYLPSFGKPTYDAHPHIELNNQKYHYVILERGKESERRSTPDLEEFFYWIFKAITWSMAVDFELSNRIIGEDCRRMIFQKQSELLGALDQNWQRRFGSETAQLLQQFPFDDVAGLRASYSGRLRKKGFAESTIEKLAFRKFPKVVP